MKIGEILNKVKLTPEQEGNFVLALKETFVKKDKNVIKNFLNENVKSKLKEKEFNDLEGTLVEKALSNSFKLCEEENTTDDSSKMPGRTGFNSGYIAGFEDGMNDKDPMISDNDSDDFVDGYMDGYNAALAELETEMNKEPETEEEPEPVENIADAIERNARRLQEGCKKPKEKSAKKTFKEGFIDGVNDYENDIFDQAAIESNDEYSDGYQAGWEEADETYVLPAEEGTETTITTEPASNEYVTGYELGYNDFLDGKETMMVADTDTSEYAQGYRDGWNTAIQDVASDTDSENEEIEAIEDNYENGYSEGYNDGYNEDEMSSFDETVADFKTGYYDGYTEGKKDSNNLKSLLEVCMIYLSNEDASEFKRLKEVCSKGIEPIHKIVSFINENMYSSLSVDEYNSVVEQVVKECNKNGIDIDIICESEVELTKQELKEIEARYDEKVFESLKETRQDILREICNDVSETTRVRIYEMAESIEADDDISFKYQINEIKKELEGKPTTEIPESVKELIELGLMSESFLTRKY